MNEEVNARKAAFLIVLIYFLAFLPLLPRTSYYRGDERFYTDAAIRMVQTGDYLTPYYHTGRVRFRKPILVYWIIVASYKVFGISLFSSRIPFLVAGCLVLFFTYRITSVLFGEREALLASAILASNMTVFHTSIRSHPDIIQCLFLAMSLYGFMNLILRGERSSHYHWLAYMGAALAVASKGGLGLLPVAFSLIFASSCKGVRVRELFKGKVIITSAAVALFWFVAISFKHGEAALRDFFLDQVGERLSGSKIYILENAFLYLGGLLKELMPWSLMSLIVLVRDWDRVKGLYLTKKKEVLLVAGWYLSIFAIFALSNIQRARYFLPTYPLLGALLASVLMEGEEGRSSKALRMIERWVLISGMVGGGLLILLGALLDLRVVVGGMIILFGSVALHRALFQRGHLPGLLAVALLGIVGFSVIHNFLRPVIFASPAPCVVREVLREGGGTVAVLDLPDKYRGQINVLSRGRIRMKIFTGNDLKGLEGVRFIVTSHAFLDRLIGRGYELRKVCGYSYREGPPLKFEEVIRAMAKGDLSPLFCRFREHYYLLTEVRSGQGK